MAGLFDYEYQLDEIKKHQPPLQKLNEIIDWEIFRKPIEEALYVGHLYIKVPNATCDLKVA